MIRLLLAVVLWLALAFWVWCIVRSGAMAERRWINWRSDDLARWRAEKRIGLP